MQEGRVLIPRVGAEISGYRLESVIARGGMSTVFLAEHLRLGRKVAVKILAGELSEDDIFRERFVRESRIAAGLDHPNIIPIYEAGEIEGLLFIAMRYVQGPHLKTLVEQLGPLAPERLLPIVWQTASALDAAHAKGLIHRDVKPGNILTDPQVSSEHQDHVYLCDFGLTKEKSSHSGLTKTGHFMGTIDYIAPEQIEGKDVDSRTDIYSFGCVLYECLTGMAPFERPTEAAVMWAHLQEQVTPVSEYRPDLPSDIDSVLSRAMAKAPVDRYQSCADLVTDLRKSIAGVHAEADPGKTDFRTRADPSEVKAPPGPPPAVRSGTPARARILAPEASVAAPEADEPPPDAAAVALTTSPTQSTGRKGAGKPSSGGVAIAIAAIVSLAIGAAGGWAFGHQRSQPDNALGSMGTETVYDVLLHHHIPDSYGQTCHELQPSVPAGADHLTLEGVFAVAQCQGPGDIEVRFYLIHATGSMQVAFSEIAEHQAGLAATRQGLTRLMQIKNQAAHSQLIVSDPPDLAPSGASCATSFKNGIADVWTRNGDFGHAEATDTGEAAGGLVACFVDPTTSLNTIMWTDNQTTLLGIASSSQVGALYDWWERRAGPTFDPYGAAAMGSG